MVHTRSGGFCRGYLKCVIIANKLGVVFRAARERSASGMLVPTTTLQGRYYHFIVEDSKAPRLSKLCEDAEPVNLKLGFDLRSI